MANGEEAKTQVYFTPKKKEMVSTQVNVNVTIFNIQRYKLHAMLKNLKNQMDGLISRTKRTKQNTKRVYKEYI